MSKIDMDFNKRLFDWRKTRKMNEQVFEESHHRKLLEDELQEYLNAKNPHDRCGELCDIVIVAINAHYSLTKELNFEFEAMGDDKDLVILSTNIQFEDLSADLLQDIGAVAKHLIEEMGYSFECAMNETLLKVESREGELDPNSQPNQQKWIKNRSPEAMAKWYTPNYEKCVVPC